MYDDGPLEASGMPMFSILKEPCCRYSDRFERSYTGGVPNRRVSHPQHLLRLFLASKVI